MKSVCIFTRSGEVWNYGDGTYDEEKRVTIHSDQKKTPKKPGNLVTTVLLTVTKKPCYSQMKHNLSTSTNSLDRWWHRVYRVLALSAF
jgi:predicted MarR family transcription regulator